MSVARCNCSESWTRKRTDITHWLYSTTELTLVAHSDSEMHSEEYLLERAGKRKIVAAYSEREPCNTGHNCASQLRSAGVKNVSWSFPWNGIGDASRAKTTRDLTSAVRNLFSGK
ncbi:nucleic acid/nucleotide deaminase domain-containing protein [Streptomyces sp. NPDC060006]|uniref:nucleic acid/nucleotide deaminase domain-containing protein n=1 Tax=unclassified Streptomyces TaxID=2593676 RepID=UPI0036A7989B